MNRKHQNIASMHQSTNDEDSHPLHELKSHAIFVAYISSEKWFSRKTVILMQGKYMLIVYHYDSNSIRIKPLKNLSGKTLQVKEKS